MKKNTSQKIAKTTRKRTSKKQSLWTQLRNSRKAQLLVVALIFGAIGGYLVVRSYADSTIGIHIAPKATNLNSRTEGPRKVADSTAAKRNVQSVYVAALGSNPNQVSVTQPLKKGTYEVCTLGRPAVGSSSGKLRVSDKPYGTQSALTVEGAFKATPTTEYIKLTCPVITLPSDTTVYISDVVTQGAYNFSIFAIKPVTTPVAGAVPCALTDEAEACWAANTGPINPNGGRYSKAQITAGQSNLKKVTSQATAPAGTSYDNGKLTVTQEGAVLDRIWLEGCIAIKAKNVTISNSLINNVRHLTCAGGNAQALASTINNGGCVGANGDGPGAMTGMVITDTEVDVNNAGFDTSAISNGNYRMNRVNFHGGNVGAWASCNATIEESYGHGLSTTTPGAIHEDVVNADSSNNITVNHNWLSGVGGGAVTGAMVFNGTWGVAEYGTVTNNFLQGGNGADARFVENQHHMVVKNNAFSSNNGYGGTNYVYGWNNNQPGMVWSGNYIPETGQTINYNNTKQ